MKKTFNRAKQFNSKPQNARSPKRFNRESRSDDHSRNSFTESRPRERFDRRETSMSTPKKTPNGFELHATTCAKCGRKCDVPFKPSGNKPIYCRSCFRDSPGEQHAGGSERFMPRERSREFVPRASDCSQEMESIRHELQELNRKFDKIMKGFKLD